MKLRRYLENSRSYSDKASDIARQLNFAGIGLVWLILSLSKGAEISDFFILVPLITITISLLVDFLQYAVGAFLWKDFYKKKINEGVSADADINIREEDVWRKKRINSFYYIKFILMVVSYIIIVILLFSLLNY